MSERKDRVVKDLHVFLFYCLAMAQPLLEVLRENAQFFIVRRSPPADLYSAAIILSLLIPGVLILFRHLLDAVSVRAGDIFHASWMWLFLGLLFLLLQRNFLSFPAITSVLIAVVCASLALYCYLKYPAIRTTVTWLSPTIVIVPLLFLFHSSISQILSAESPIIPHVKVNSKTPVIVLVLDELPLGSLLTDDMQIDEVCFPNFARLQRQSVWYRNASSVTDLTDKGVAAVITGVYPDVRRLSTNFDYPENLFTLLAASYELNVRETATRFRPEKTIYHPVEPETYRERMTSMFLDFSAIYLQIVLPIEYAKKFPSLGNSWRDFWQLEAVPENPKTLRKKRDKPVLDFIESIHGPSRPALYFLHVVLPHGPWMYFPSGTEYNYSRWSSPLAKEENLRGWARDQNVAHRAFQRYMIQLVYIDRLLGRLLDRLEAQQFYDSSMLIVTADHGICFDWKETDRSITNTNYVDALSVPLFVKFPFQKNGTIEDRNVETVDLLPTIADVLEIDPGWKWDGESLLRPSKRTKRRAFGWMLRDGKPFEFPSFSYDDSKTLKVKLELFGSKVPLDRLYRLGPLPEVQGVQLDKLPKQKTDTVTVTLYNRKYLENVDLAKGFVPALISGKLRFQNGAPNQSTIVLALNGTARGSAESFPIDKNTAGFALLVPELSFRQGKNEVDVLVRKQDGYLQLPVSWID